MRNNPIKGKPNQMSDTVEVTLDQQVSNPVGSKENTDKGPEKWNAPKDLGQSSMIVFDQNVVNPIGSSKSTDKGVYQEPLPMRPIPS